MIAEGSIVRGWASSTASKVTQLVDQFLIDYPQERVRKTTSKLLSSLFKKGSESQRESILSLLMERLGRICSMGKASEQFLSLLVDIFKQIPGNLAVEKAKVFGRVMEVLGEIFEKVTGSKNYPFYSLCSNMINFGNEFKPYLLEANGCLKCFGRPEFTFEQVGLDSIREELRVHINNIEWVLKKTYELNGLSFNFRKKINFRNMVIYMLDENGNRKQLGKFSSNDTIPPFSVTTHAIGITFQFNKIRRTHINCNLCSSSEEYSVLCSKCVSKTIDVTASAKVVSGQPQSINKQLTSSFSILNQLRSQLQNFTQSVQHQTKSTPISTDIILEMESCYSNIIKNLKLLRKLSESELKEEKQKYSQQTDCYSCHFFELSACINFVAEILKDDTFELPVPRVAELLVEMQDIFFKNKVKSLTTPLSSILAQLLNRTTSISFFQELQLTVHNSSLVHKLLINLLCFIKTSPSHNDSLLTLIKQWIFTPSVNSHFSLQEKVELFIHLQLDGEYFSFISESFLQHQKLQDLKRISQEEYKIYSGLLNFPLENILQEKITNLFKIFFTIIPQEQLPTSSLDIVDADYLKYIKSQPPVITDELIMNNIVLAPNPIIKLNMFQLLPEIIEQLPLEQSIELIRQLCKYKNLWNTNIISTVQKFSKKLEEVEKERKFMLCLEGYQASKEDLYFQQIYKILTPQRTNFIIRLEIPEKEMSKEQKNKGGPVEYIYLPTREVKSEQLKSDTIGGLHQWITSEIRKIGQDMPFDLIVQNNIIDNLDLSLEIVYKKIVQKQSKRQIGSQTYDFFRVIYRIQGIFGQANQRNCGNPRDQKLQECINFSSHLLSKLPCKKTGLDVLMGMIPTLEQEQNKQMKQKMIKILGIIFKNESIIEKIVEWDYGNHILDMTVKSIELNKQQIRQTETLLEMCSKIIDEANLEMVKIRKASGVFGNRRPSEADMDIEPETEESEKSVKYILEKVKEAEQNGFKNISKKLIKMLPFCSRDDPSASKFLFDFFEVSKIIEVQYSQKLTWFLEYINALSESYSSFKMICREEGITEKMVNLIDQGLAMIQKENLDSHQIYFSLCKGLLQGDIYLQDLLFEKGLLGKIYQVAGIGLGGLPEQKRTKLGKIPLICFQITKYFQQGKMISPSVHEYFTRQEQEKKKSIQKQKLQRKKQIMMKQNKIKEVYRHLMVEQKQEEISCSSCKEGYAQKKEVLGVYLYSTKVQILNLQSWWKDNKKMQAITSTSYFEPIHLDCHIKAMKDDQKIQKSQWDGAIIRNSEVLCNNWCPFPGAETTNEDFDRTFLKYFQKCNKNVSPWIVMNDLSGLLEKFSKEYNFALQTKGSSPSHNAKLIPVLIYLTCHLLQSSEDIKFVKEGMTHIQSHLTKKPSLVHLYFCMLLFTTPTSSFSSKRDFCLRLIEHLSLGNFKDIKPFFIELALIEKIMQITQKNVSPANLISELCSCLKKNLEQILHSFEDLADEYKNIYCHWENIEQAKNYFQK